MKKTLAILLSVLMLVAICIPVSAVTFETVEGADNSVEAVAGAEKAEAALAAEINPETDKYDATYGTLIYYNDFDMYTEGATIANNSTNTYDKVYGLDAKLAVSSAGIDITAVKSAYGDDTENIAAQLTHTSNQYPQLIFYLTNTLYGTGTYNVVFDVCVPEGKTAASSVQLQFNKDGTSDPRPSVTTPTAGAGWKECIYDGEKASNRTSNGLTFLGIYITSTAYSTDCLLIDNVKIYYIENNDITAEMLNLPEGKTGGYISTASTPIGTAFTAEEGLTGYYYGKTLPTLYVPGYTFLGWYDSEGNKVSIYTTTEIEARWLEHKPGYNVLTGTTEVATFEEGFRYNVGIGTSSSAVVANPYADAAPEDDTEKYVNTSSKVLKSYDVAGQYTQLMLPAIYEKDRRYTLKFDAYFDATYGDGTMTWMYDLAGTNVNSNTTGLNLGVAQGAWTARSFDFQATANSSLEYAWVQQKMGSTAALSKTAVVYYDNMALIPWYKVFYMAADGVTVDTEWYAAPNTVTGGISTSVNPAWNGEGNMKLVGWSQEGVNGTVISKYTTTPGEDVYLYPVYEDAGDNYLRNNVVAATNTGGQHVFANKMIDTDNTTWNVGTTGAVVEYKEATNSFAVKGANISGEIAFNLAFTDGTTATETVYLVSGNKWKPGLNTYTGTTKPLDFEAFTTADLIKALDNGSGSTSYFSIQENPDKTGNNTSDKIVSISTQFQYLFNIDFATNIEPARPVHFSYDVKSNKGQYLMINSWGGNDLYTSPGSSTSWTTNQYRLCMATSTGGLKSTSATNAKTNGIKIIGIGTQSGTYAYNTEGNNYQYIDNLMIVPGYKITYVTGEDTSVVDYVLYSDEATKTIATTYTPWGNDKLVVPYTGEGLKKQIGWSTSEGATEAMTSVPLKYEDIKLFPVYADTEETFTGSTLMSGKTNAVTTIYFTKTLDTEATTVDTGKTEATVICYETLNAYAIKATGYSGKVTINAVYADATTETVEIKLLGGEKWKPGLNLITGTTGAFDFENDAETALAVELTQGAAVIENPKVSDANDSGYVVKMGYDSTVAYNKGMFPLLTSKQTAAIEKERGVLVNLDYVGNWHIFWLIPKSDSGDYFISATKDGDDWATSSKHYSNSKNDFVITRFQVKSTDDNLQDPREVLVDNVAFIPAYKFTYIDLDGSETVVYKITDGEGNIITTHTPAFASGATKYTVNDGTEVCTGAYTLANEDVVFTAVAPELGMDETVTSRIDVDGENVTGGIRFKASIAHTDKENEAITEYGFIVARQSHLTKLNAELTHEFMHPTATETPLYATGVSFDRATGMDKVFDKDETNCYFTGVCVNIPTETAATVKENLVARPYMAVQIGENTIYVYGNTNAYSLGQAMLDVKTAEGTDYTNNQEYVDRIVDLYNTAE